MKKNDPLLFGLILLCLISFFFSCKSPYKNYEIVENGTPKNSFYSVFSVETNFSYATKINYKSFEFNGNTFAKIMKDGSYRVQFSTQNGAIALDATFDSSQVKIHESLNLIRRKGIWKVIEGDLRLLFDNISKANPVETLKAPDSDKKIFRFKNKNMYRYYYFDKKEELKKVEEGSKKKPKVTAFYKNYDIEPAYGRLPALIEITHQTLDLKISFVKQ